MNDLTSILYIVLAMMIVLVIALIIVFLMIKAKEKKNQNAPAEGNNSANNQIAKAPTTTKIAKEYETKSVFDFMEFENVKDNMIVQKDGKRFLMAIECQGVNYDLMSEVEKTSTEQGFATFLNTLKEPIQIYIQTRTVNLEKNIQSYKERLGKIKDELNLKEYRLKQYLEQSNPSEKVIKDRQFEVLRENNLYDYGRDIIADTERMSLNKNVLKKKYYIIIKYFYEPTDTSEEDVLSKDEIADTAFSNLYTKAASIIRVLSGIGIVGRALNSFELVDLLYNAYNRDDSEVFGIDKAIDSGFNEIYVDAQSSIDKKIDALNREIQLKAQERVNDTLKEIEDERDQELADIEENLEDIIINLAKKMIEDENNNIPEAVKAKAIDKIENKKVGKGAKKVDGKKETKESNRKRRAG